MRARLALAVLLALPAPAFAEETAQFLKVGVGARALGMGGAYTAVADEVGAVGWNPAGLAALKKREVGLTHAELPASTHYDFAAFAAPTRFGTLAAAGTRLAQGSLDGRDENGRPTGSFSASDTALTAAWGSRLDAAFSLGGAVKYIQSAIASDSARTVALDLGAQYQLRGLGWRGMPLLGASVQNLGRGLRFADQTSPLPLTVAVGAGYRLPEGLLLAVDYKQRPYARTSEVSVGTEYAVIPSFALRAGYGSAKAASAGGAGGGLSSLNGMAAGFGLRALGYSLDYSITPFGELGNVQRLSLGARF